MKAKRKNRTSLPESLRAGIKGSGKTAHQLADETGVSHTVISRFLRAERDIRLETAELLAAAVGLELNAVKRRRGK